VRGQPPPIPPERLFRSLLRQPRARAIVDLQLGAGRRGAFFVCAPSAVEELDAFDRVPEAAPPFLRRALIMAELAALTLHNGERRVFASARDVLALDEDYADIVMHTTLLELERIAPSYRRSDVAAWLRQLELGAVHGENHSLATRLACSVDVSLGKGAVPRPDRFFGVPTGALTDGQWLAYRAARHALIEVHLPNK
jgi:hypothetical protein